MLIHNTTTFIVPVSPGDTVIQIQNIQSSITFEIRPYSITAQFVDQNMVKVKTTASDQIITIHFLSDAEALEALVLLQAAINLLKQQVVNIPDDIRIYIDNKFLDLALPTIVFRQETPSCEWLIDHDIPKKVAITVTDDDLKEIEGLIQYDGNDIKVFFNQEITGWVFA